MLFPNVSPELLGRDLVFDFFWKFSVVECALKRTGRLFSYANGDVKADWDKFGKEITATTDLQSAAKQLIELAPKKQRVQDGPNGKYLGWNQPSQGKGETEIQFAMRLLRTVRNNLFHGGKYPDGPIDEIARDKKILQASLQLLEECYLADPEVRSRFDSSINELGAHPSN